MIRASLLARVAALAAALNTFVLCAPAFASAASRAGEDTPLDLDGASAKAGGHVGGGGSLVRTIVGLAIVIGVIYGVAWVLRQVKQGRSERTVGGLASVATVGLGSGRAMHLVRAGNELVLVGVGEHGVTPIRTYSEAEALAAGLVDEWGELVQPAETVDARPAKVAKARPRPQLPAPRELVESLRQMTVRR